MGGSGAPPDIIHQMRRPNIALSRLFACCGPAACAAASIFSQKRGTPLRCVGCNSRMSKGKVSAESASATSVPDRRQR